jgi:hypothetical protein
MPLPDPIQTYFAAQPPQDGDAFATAFAPDAIVHDEGHIHRGREEIRTWWQASKEKYHHRAEPLEATEAAGRTMVRARVSGNFPGSPAVLSFTFGLAGDRIAELEIS